MNRRVLKILASLAALAAVALGGGAIAAATGAFDAGEPGQVTGAEADRARDAALRAAGGGTANSVDREREGGSAYEVEVTRTDGSTVDVRLDESFNVVATDGESEDSREEPDDDDRGEPERESADDQGVDDRGEKEGESGDAGEPVTGREAEQARAAAVRAAGGGTAGAAESDSGNGARYEVEVTRKDGSKVDVDLDEAFNVVAVDRDAE